MYGKGTSRGEFDRGGEEQKQQQEQEEEVLRAIF